MISVLKEAIIGSFESIYLVAIIVFPLMVILQIAKDYKFLDKISKSFKFLTRFFNMSEDSTLPLLVGIVFGIVYGAGIIIQSSEEGNLSQKDMFLTSVFLIVCHAIIEDTLIFVAVGANGYILAVSRILAATIMTLLLSRRIKTNGI
ncbi:MAG TPA: nucleoside recognition domain-containing protein [Oscillospiraceae bacterium]|nr:nucleoside recognition domain-containing protein [Oscillospiraceae bacterium]